MTVNDFWLEYEESAREESGGGGIVARTRIETGYKVYVQGLPQESTFFASTQDKATKATAKKQASAVGENPKWGIQIRAFRDGAYSAGKPATWQNDRFFNTDSWTEATKQVVVPSLRDAGVVLPWEGWARIGFKPDPYFEAKGTAGMTDTDQQGNPRFPQVAYITEVFENEAAALEAVGVSAGNTASAAPVATPTGDAPDGWDAATWQKEIPNIKASTASPVDLARDYGVTPADIVKARNS